MGNLAPVAFDIETSGFESSAVITVAGFAFELGYVVILNTAGRAADAAALEETITAKTSYHIEVHMCQNESELLTTLGEISKERIDGDSHYLTAYHGETWNGGFDLPFVRTACVRCNTAWPFPDVAYADVMDVVQRFETHEHNDLVGTYNVLIGDGSCDPFEDSKEAVDAFNDGEWLPLLLHNLADISRTRELAVLGGQYVAKSDFNMKNLAPPNNKTPTSH